MHGIVTTYAKPTMRRYSLARGTGSFRGRAIGTARARHDTPGPAGARARIGYKNTSANARKNTRVSGTLRFVSRLEDMSSVYMKRLRLYDYVTPLSFASSGALGVERTYIHDTYDTTTSRIVPTILRRTASAIQLNFVLGLLRACTAVLACGFLGSWLDDGVFTFANLPANRCVVGAIPLVHSPGPSEHSLELRRASVF